MNNSRTPFFTAWLLAAVAIFSTAAASAAMDHSKHMQHAAPAGALADIVGMSVDDFQLLDEQGQAHRLYYYNDAPAIVIMTQGNGCPIVRNAMPVFSQVRNAYADKGVEFFLLNSNLQDDRESVAKEVAEFEWDIPVLIDDNQLVGESMRVTRTAEIFVIDPRTRTVVYHGPVDDRLTYQVQKAEAKHTYLADALDAVIAGEPVPVAQVDAPGCIVNFPERGKRDAHAAISYHDSIAPILEERCVACHTEGGIGPWAMSSYDMVKGFAPMIREVIRTDRMPPWHADPAIGHFLRDKSLTDEEIKTLVHWIEAGAPRGDGPDPLAVPRELPGDWPMGQPDLIVDIPAFDVPASGVVDYQRPAILNPLEEPKWLKASTVKVGSRQAVHHVLTGLLEEMPANGIGDESKWGASVGGYAVGSESYISRDDVGTYMPVGGAIGFQMHYTPYGKAVTDATQIGFYFYEEAPTYVQRNTSILDVTIEIPPHTARHEEVAYLVFPRDAELFYAFPHAHYRGHSSTLTLQKPDGSEEVILSLPKYDFNWQRSYEYVDPIQIPAGSKLIARYQYDNTARNPANPDPSLTITWGDQSFEEMLFTNLSYRWAEETRDNPKPHFDKLMRAGQGFGMLDDDIDGALTKADLKGGVGQRIAQNFDRMDRDGDGVLTWDEYMTVVLAQR
ncbi:redoxin domain-containing protein [Halioglobus pacificus]|uniref:Thiol-disulfide isomerase n=1 Tax=Parahalioglobus pacificus TaxID=930806 RepID=A0A919CIS0_9GAMM|nr:redoxin domain-containing protein [Halioglobus pacificus]GHD27961.1 thiol-disulfide isomerase [Halioglobus pacificus]